MNKNYYHLKDEILTIVCGKAEYRFRHRTDPSIGLDTWLVQQIAVNGIIIMRGTDIEGPIKQVGAADFIGGIHGDEVYFLVRFLIDGAEISSDSEIVDTTFDRMDIFVRSHLFFCDSTRLAFTREKHLSFEGNRLTIGNILTYMGDEIFYVQRWPASGIFSIYKDVMNGYTVNTHCQFVSDTGTPADHAMDRATFFCEGYTVEIRALSEKYASYLGFVHNFAKESRPRFKVYFDTLSNALGEVILKKGDTVRAAYEIRIV